MPWYGVVAFSHISTYLDRRCDTIQGTLYMAGNWSLRFLHRAHCYPYVRSFAGEKMPCATFHITNDVCG